MKYRRWLAEDTLAIFLFHGVLTEPAPGIRNYTVKHLLEGRFREVIAELATHGTPISISQAAASLRGVEPLPPRSFVISFDDGFLNNHEVAAPILEDLRVPAVFYVTTEFVEHNAASWIDVIEFAVDTTQKRFLELPWAAEPRPCSSTAEKIALLDEVRAVVKQAADQDPYELSGCLLEAAKVPPFEPLGELDEKMSWDEVRELHAHDLFTVGGHGHTHRILGFLDEPALDREVSESLRILRRQLGGPLTHYSYPEGLATSYAEPVIRKLRDEGIEVSPTAEPGINEVGDDLFRLRRVTVV